MRSSYNFRVLGFICLSTLYLFGCGVPDITATITPKPSLRPTLTVDFTASATPELTSTATPGPTQTSTSTPTKTPRPTHTQTYTPFPTLPPEEALERVLELLETNGGCRLPCWWGITPGKTEGKAAMDFLSTFAAEVDIIRKREDRNIFYTFSVPEEYQSDGKMTVEVRIEDGLVRVIGASGVYNLQKMLSEYGKPDQVLIWGISTYTMAEKARYTLVLIYEDQGILAAYDGTAEKKDPISICPSSISSDGPVVLFLWSPQSGDKIEEIGPETFFEGPPWQPEFFPLEEATGLTIDEFYQIFKDPQNAGECFEMPDPDLKPRD